MGQGKEGSQAERPKQSRPAPHPWRPSSPKARVRGQRKLPRGWCARLGLGSYSLPRPNYTHPPPASSLHPPFLGSTEHSQANEEVVMGGRKPGLSSEQCLQQDCLPLTQEVTPTAAKRSPGRPLPPRKAGRPPKVPGARCPREPGARPGKAPGRVKSWPRSEPSQRALEAIQGWREREIRRRGMGNCRKLSHRRPKGWRGGGGEANVEGR